ncbi:MAG TPA: glycosyltransferase family 39 protein [Pirellulaceae bacterium]|nr:glycosyltransferase family 39 protein [Pirellulaceae bacterium]
MPPDEHSASATLTPGSASAVWRLVSLAAITALAAFLRLWQAGESLWIDELHTSWVVSGTLDDVLPRAAMGNQSPLYFWGMWLLVQVTGQSEWTLRLPSLVAGIALPAVVFYLVGQVSNLSKDNSGQVKNLSYVSLAAALLVAIDPVCIFYAQEARPYAWVMLLAVVELVLLKRLIERPTLAWRLALLANSLVLFYLHYTTAIFLGGLVVMLPMLVRVTGSAYQTRNLVLDLLLAAALAAPGVVQMTHIFERRTNWEAFVQNPSWQKLFTEVPFAAWALAGAVVVALTLLVPRVLPGNALTRGFASAAQPTASRPNALWYFVLLGSILIPLQLSWSITAFDAARIYHIRYLVALVPLSAAAACLAIAWVPWRAVQVTALVALAGWHLYDSRMIVQFGRDGRFLAARSEDWRSAIAFLNSQIQRDPTAIIIVEPSLIEERGSNPDEYELFAVDGLYRLSHDETYSNDSLNGIKAEVALLQLPPTDEPRRAWYVIRGAKPAHMKLTAWLDEVADYYAEEILSGKRNITEHQTFQGVCVIRTEWPVKQQH